MSTFGCTAPRPIAFVACALALGLLASEAEAKCDWAAGSTPYMPFEFDTTSTPMWVPLDAEIGRVIADLDFNIGNRNAAQLRCFYEDSPRTTISMPTSTAIAPGVPVRGHRFADNVLRTNIDGIGAIITMGRPYDGTADNFFTSDDGSQTIPYKGTMRTNTPLNVSLDRMRGNVKLIKTGPIAPGEHVIDKEMFHGITNDKGRVMDFTLKGRVHTAYCTALGKPISTAPVEFSDHTLADFTGPGPVGREVDFNIKLNGCMDHDTAPTAFAYIELDGTNGSSVVDATRGIFSLGTGSTAEGFGIQIRHGDGRELPLQQAVPVKRLNAPEVQLDFKARYWQLDNTVKDGQVNAALNFTITYR